MRCITGIIINIRNIVNDDGWYENAKSDKFKRKSNCVESETLFGCIEYGQIHKRPNAELNYFKYIITIPEAMGSLRMYEDSSEKGAQRPKWHIGKHNK